VSINNLLRQAREIAGLSIEQAAGRIGISGASYSRMETGRSRVTTERLDSLAALYGVSASALLDGCIATRPSTVDLNRMRQVVEIIQTALNRMKVRPSPEKMGLAVAEVYRLEIDHIITNPQADFDPARHAAIIDAIFRT